MYMLYVYVICICNYRLVYALSNWFWGKFVALPNMNQVVLANSAFQRYSITEIFFCKKKEQKTEEQIQCDRIKCSLTSAMRKNCSNYSKYIYNKYTTIGID